MSAGSAKGGVFDSGIAIAKKTDRETETRVAWNVCLIMELGKKKGCRIIQGRDLGKARSLIAWSRER